jgi:hypothetical protein
MDCTYLLPQIDLEAQPTPPRSCEVRRTIHCIRRWLNTLYLNKMEVLSSLKWFLASVMS